jgi:hypothetical protein
VVESSPGGARLASLVSLGCAEQDAQT